MEFVDSAIIITTSINTSRTRKKENTAVTAIYTAKIISYIDKEAFLANLGVPSLVLDPPDDVDHLMDLYDSTLIYIVDDHAPLRKKEMPMLLWYN